jgi:hypothetical protein
MNPTTNVPDDPTDRPFRYSSIFWWGLFDKNSEGSRYMRRRSWIGLAFVAAGILLTPMLRAPLGPEIARFVPVIFGFAAAVWIATTFTRYLRCLDEMQRQLHYEPMAITYGVVMAAALVLGCLQLTIDWRFNPLYVVFAEPIRGLALAVVTRRRA